MRLLAHHPPRHVVPVAACLAAAALGLAYFGLRAAAGWTWRSDHSRAHPTAHQQAALEYEYPSPSGSLPGNIKFAYDESRDRTRMTIELRTLAASAGEPYRLGNVRLTLVSEYSGRTRSLSDPELSVIATLTAVSNMAGVLAASSPGQFVADGATLSTRFSNADKSPYSSKKQGSSVLETLHFKINTETLLAVVKAKQVQAQFGMLDLRFGPAPLADLREFAARMNPHDAPSPP